VGAWLLLQGCGVVTGSGNEVSGERTKFTTEFTVGDSISIKGLEPALITEIVSDEKLIVKTPHEHPITEKVPYKIFKKVDQSNVYQHVWAALGRGDWYAARLRCWRECVLCRVEALFLISTRTRTRTR